MRAFRTITTLIMTAGFGFFGGAKVVQASVVTDTDGWSRLSPWQWAAIGLLEVGAVVALLLALHPRLRKLGIAAAIGLATLAGCAVVYHLINSDPFGDIAPAIVQGVVAASYAALGLRSLNDTRSASTSRVTA